MYIYQSFLLPFVHFYSVKNSQGRGVVEGAVNKTSSKLRIALLPQRSPEKENLFPYEKPTYLLCLLYCYPLIRT